MPREKKSTKLQRCFVIMPFSKTSKVHTEKYWTEQFNSFLKPLIEECVNLEAYRSKPLREDILRQIITDLVIAPIVVADLTDHNSNVYWELGVRQSFKHGTVTIAEQGTHLPFDIGGKGTLFYHPNDHLKNADFSRAFKEAVEDCLSNPDRPDSDVLETISGRGTLFEILKQGENLRKIDAILSQYNANIQLLKKIVKQSQRNLDTPKKRTVLSGRFGISAIELLITTRYLDEDPKFYKCIEEYFDAITKLNGSLITWAVLVASIDTYFLKYEGKYTKTFKEFKKQILSVREELSKKL